MPIMSAQPDSPAVSFPLPAGVNAQTVLSVQHYSDRLFRFRLTRPETLKFRSGEFVMIGLPNAEKPVYRAYSIASPNWADHLEFVSIKVPGGPLTEHLQRIEPGDTVLIRGKPTGTLVLDALLPGRTLYMLSTGTGIAPFGAVVRDPDSVEHFENLVVTQTCRTVAELGYINDLSAEINADPDIAEIFGGKVHWLRSVTREPYPCQSRVTDMLRSGELFTRLELPPLDPEKDRVMICGSMAMLKETRQICESMGLIEGSNNRPGTFVVERAFVD